MPPKKQYPLLKPPSSLRCRSSTPAAPRQHHFRIHPAHHLYAQGRASRVTSYQAPIAVQRRLFSTASQLLHHNMTATTDSTSAAPAVSSPPAKRVKTDSNTMDAIPLQVKKLAPSAKLPTRGSAFAAGYDVYASKDTTVPARGKVLVDTDISIAVPAGTCESQLVPIYS